MKPAEFPHLQHEGKRLRAERKRMGLTQASVAKAVHVSAMTVSRFERGLIVRHWRAHILGAGELAVRLQKGALPDFDAGYVCALEGA